MNNFWTTGVFVFAVITQIVVPAEMVVRHESVLRTGDVYLFKTMPVDPYDAFRGRYISFNLNASDVPKNAAPVDLHIGQKVFARIGPDEQGFSKFSEILKERPKSGSYMEATVSWIIRDKIRLMLPVNRYYMEEKAAPRADRLLARRRQQTSNAYVRVRVKGGFPVVEGLYVDGRRIEDAIKEPSSGGGK